MASVTPKGYAGWNPQRKSAYWKERRRQKATLLNPTQPLSGQSLLDAAKASVNLETQPQISALDTQARSTRIQEGAVSARSRDYYHQIAQEEQAALDRTRALSDRMAGQHADIAAQGQATLDRTQAVADQAQAQDTGVRGEGLSGGGDARVREELAAARARQSSNDQAASNQGANTGGNWEGLLSAMSGATSMRGGEVQQQYLNKMGNELSDIRTRKADIQSLSGAKLVKTLTDMRQQAFENAATAQTLGQKDLALQYQQEAAQADRALAQSRLTETTTHNRTLEQLASDRIKASEKSARAGRRTTQRGQTLSHNDRVAGQNLSHADRVAARKQRERLAKNGGGSKGAAIPTNARGALSLIGNIQTEYQNRGGGKLSPADQKKVAGDLRKNLKNPPPLLLNIGSALGTRGFLTGQDITRLKAAYPGIKIPASWTRR